MLLDRFWRERSPHDVPEFREGLDRVQGELPTKPESDEASAREADQVLQWMEPISQEASDRIGLGFFERELWFVNAGKARRVTVRESIRLVGNLEDTAEVNGRTPDQNHQARARWMDMIEAELGKEGLQERFHGLESGSRFPPNFGCLQNSHRFVQMRQIP